MRTVPMKWQKLGLIEAPEDLAWMKTYLQNPFPEYRGDDVYRVHIAGRDEHNQARGGWVEISMTNPTEALRFSAQPTLPLGELGAFDDCGAMPSCVFEHKGTQYMYFTGWSRAGRTPYSFFIGLAISKDNGKTFQRVSKAPVLGRTHHDPFLTAAPSVMIENGVWRMWYVSCVKWVEEPAGFKHFYHIRYAESEDGIDWKTDGTVCIDFEGDEYAIARPIVNRVGDRYIMWFCARGGERRYAACYAESSDGIAWERNDSLAGLDTSEEGFDSEVICYPCPLEHAGKQYLFYNGNDYGKAGFGVAIEV